MAAAKTSKPRQSQRAENGPATPSPETDQKQAGFIAIKEYQEASWSKRLLIALAADGPALLELSVGIGGQSLEDVAEVTIEQMAATVLDDLSDSDDMPSQDAARREKTQGWATLLQHPLIRSGWIGKSGA